jgi:hypothetical protein
MTDEQWKEIGTIFKRIHQIMLPPFGFESLRKETFDPTEYIRWVHVFEAQHLFKGKLASLLLLTKLFVLCIIRSNNCLII